MGKEKKTRQIKPTNQIVFGMVIIVIQFKKNKTPNLHNCVK